MNTQELIAAITEALPNAANGEWRCDPDTGNIFTTEHLNVGYVHMMPDLTLCVLAKQMASALIASQERERVLREALEGVRDRFFPANQPERDRDLQWDEVNEALQSAEQQG